MALTIEFEATGTNDGVLIVRGLSRDPGNEVLAAVQRATDGRWLTLHGLWGPDANWFPCPRRAAHPETRPEPDRDAAAFAVPPPLCAGLLAAPGQDLVVHLRRFDYTDAGVLLRRAADTPQAPDPETEPEPLGTRPRPRRVPRHAHWWAWGTGALVLAAGTLLWSLLAPRPRPDDGPRSPTTAATPPGPTAAPALTGRALAASLKAQGLDPADLFRAAERAAAAHDCDAAIRLFIDAAKAQAPLADRLAGRYDPEGFSPSPCFPDPIPDSALRWYQQAAEQGLPRAQRRLGELLLAEGHGGPLYREALDWLRKAAAAGDPIAARRLSALGEP